MNNDQTKIIEIKQLERRSYAIRYTTMSFLLPLFHVGQAIGSAYAATFSIVAISNLSKREEQTERAAQYSNTAAHQLHKTRTTQTSGALAVSMTH